MHKLVLSFALTLTTLLALPITPAEAQNARNWVASFGSDNNNCTRSLPCATFQRALSQTNAGGEINCVDHGDFGSGVVVSITTSITIDCEGVQGRFTGSVGDLPAIVVNASATDVVVLRGLDIDGNGTGTYGIGWQRRSWVWRFFRRRCGPAYREKRDPQFRLGNSCSPLL